jgi:DNA polymerase-3 subunit alpha
MGALSITDHGNIHGWLDHYEHCREHDIKPILGLEAYQARKSRFDRDEEERSGPARNEWDQRGPYHLGVIAQNAAGYRNLIKLSSRAYTEGYFVKPRLDLDLISQHAEGIIVLSGCLGGAVQQALLRGDFDAALQHASTMQEIVGKDNYFIEIQDHGIEEQRRVKEDTLKIAKMIGAKVVATGDCHYVLKEDAHSHDVMLCAGTKATFADEKRFKFEGDGFFLHSYDEMLKKFEPEWLQNTCDLADMVDVALEFGEFHFPKFPDVPKEKTPDEFLEEQLWEGLKDRYGDPLPQEVIDRANHELGVVKRMGFIEYFLVVGDLVRWAKNNGIRVGFGRGSAAGSILSYALKITNLDPIKFGLIFERFLVEGRKSMPDIDLDFDDRYRDKVIQYARDKYGEDRVCQIATFSTVGARAAVRDAARVLGYEYELADRISKLMPPPVLGVSKSLEESLSITPELKALYDGDADARDIIDSARGLEGVFRQTGIHAAGVVIAPGPLTDYVPVMQKGENTPLVSQWDMRRLEEVGMLKVDCLALRNLGVIDMTVKAIKENSGIDIDPDNLPLDDEDVFAELSRGDTMGVFQMESPGMQEMTAAVRPSSVDDLMAIVSLYRPGPMGSGMDKMYINRKHGREPVAYPHPILENVLDQSYGIMLYQEDVLNATRAVTGWGADQADDLRKVIGKKLMEKVGKYREKFVSDAKDNDIEEKISNKIYSDIEYFAGYGFNKAHAASYGMVSYVTAWLRTHYPAEYMAACLTSTANKKPRLAQYLNHCRKMGIEVLPPSVDISESEFTVNDSGQIVFGLSAIDGLGDKIVDPLLASRPEDGFGTLYGFLRHADKAVLNKAAIEHLTRSGALDTLVWFDPESEVGREDMLEILEEEKKEIGLYVTEHPLSDIWPYLEKDVSHEIADLMTYTASEPVRLGGIITNVQKKVTKANKQMIIMSFEDLTGDITSLVFPGMIDKVDTSDLVEGHIGIMSGRVMRETDEDGENVFVKLAFNGFTKLSDSAINAGPPIMLKTESRLTPKQIERLNDIIGRVNGTSPVYVTMREGNHDVTFRFKKATSYSIRETLEQIVSLNEVLNG